MLKGAYLAKTKGGTQTSNLPTNFSSVSSNQGGGPAGMTFQEAASVQTPGGGIMSQQEAQQAQQQINQNQPATTPQGESAEDIKKRLEEERIKKQNESAQQQVLNMLFGAEGDTSVKKSAFEKSGKHPLRAQLDYLIAKYGDDVVNTEQGKVLMGYLAGVPVERGGGLGAQDENYGLTGDEAKEFQSKLLLDEDFMDGQNYRNSLLRQVAGMTNTMGGQFDFSNIDPERASQGLSPEQYYNFRQQLMAADATPENQAYKDAFPGSSGAGLGAILEKVMPGSTAISAITGGILPERNMVGYQGTNDPFAATFRALPQSQDRDNMAGLPMGQHPLMAMPAVVDDSNVGDIIENLLGPKKTAGTTAQTVSPFDINQFYADLPQYTYGQQGVMSPSINPNLAEYYENLRRYYG